MKPFRHDYITSQVLRFHQTALRYSASALNVVAILEGRAQVKRFSRLSEMSAGDVFFVNAGEVWAMTSREGCTALCVEIETALLPQVSYPYADRVQLVDSLVDPDQTREVSLVYRDCIFLKDILETYALFNQKEKASQRPLMEEKLGLTLVMEYNVQNEVNRQFRAVSEDKFVRYYRIMDYIVTVSYTHLRAHETGRNLVCRLLLEKKKKTDKKAVIPRPNSSRTKRKTR